MRQALDEPVGPAHVPPGPVVLQPVPDDFAPIGTVAIMAVSLMVLVGIWASMYALVWAAHRF